MLRNVTHAILPQVVNVTFVAAPEPLTPPPPKTVPLVQPKQSFVPPLPQVHIAQTEPTITLPPPASSEPAPAVAAPVAPAAPPAPPQPAAPKTVSGVEYVRMPQPVYPSISRRMGETGVVMLRVLIGEKGTAEQVTVQKSSGSNNSMKPAARPCCARCSNRMWRMARPSRSTRWCRSTSSSANDQLQIEPSFDGVIHRLADHGADQHLDAGHGAHAGYQYAVGRRKLDQRDARIVLAFLNQVFIVKLHSSLSLSGSRVTVAMPSRCMNSARAEPGEYSVADGSAASSTFFRLSLAEMNQRLPISSTCKAVIGRASPGRR
jgi:hypothetical protein